MRENCLKNNKNITFETKKLNHWTRVIYNQVGT